MSKKYIVLLLLFICGISSPIFSQDNVPGYLGKRAMIEYNYNAPLVYLFPYRKGNHLHSFNFHYILKRRTQIGLIFDTYSINSRDGDSFGSNTNSNDVKGNAIGINFDWYRKGLLAPVGMYFRLEAKYLFGNYIENVVVGTTCCPPANLIEITENPYNHMAYSFGYGIRRIFKDIVVFNVGGTVGFVRGGGFDASGYNAALNGAYNLRVHAGLGVLLF